MDGALRDAVDLILQAAGKLDMVCSLAKEGEEITSYVTASHCLREMATGLLPEQPGWPEGGAKIITLEEEKRRRRK